MNTPLPIRDLVPRDRPARRKRLAISLYLAVALITACSSNSTDLAALAEETFASEDVWRGDASYLSVTITEANFLSVIELETYLDELGFTPAVFERMNRTRALDGTQSASSEIANVTWTYHPDDGLQVVFEKEVGQ